MVLMAWRQRTYDSDPISILYDIQDIITEGGICIIAKLSPPRLHRDGPDAITKELEETLEWGSQYAAGMFEEIWRHDHSDIAQVSTYKQ
jgi:hypothetical protein